MEERQKPESEVDGESFHLGDILTVVTAKGLSPQGWEGLRKILNYMSGSIVFSNQIPRVLEECRPYLVEQYPFLQDISGSDINENNWCECLQEKIEQFGEELTVRPIPPRNRHIIDPAEEMREQMGPNRPVIDLS